MHAPGPRGKPVRPRAPDSRRPRFRIAARDRPGTIRARMEIVDYHGRRLVRWSVGPSTFVAAPEDGARLLHWHVARGDGSEREVIHWPPNADPADFARVRGGNPILFPFCGRTFDEGEIHYWRDTTGVRRRMPMHGLARQGRFEVQRVDDTGFHAVFRPTAEDMESYPYQYEFSVIYRFLPASLAVELRLRNLDRQPVPWSAGHHFYFTLPWQDGTRRANYTLDLPAARATRHQADGRLAPWEKPPARATFDDPALVNRIHLGLASEEVRCARTDGSESLVLRIGDDTPPPDWATVVTWTETEASPYYCVEPWMGPPNSPQHKTGYHVVKPGRSQSFLVTVTAG